MLKDIPTPTDLLEILFWDGVFRLVKVLQQVRYTASRLRHGFSSEFRWKLFVLVVLFDAGVTTGMVLGFLHSLIKQ